MKKFLIFFLLPILWTAQTFAQPLMCAITDTIRNQNGVAMQGVRFTVNNVRLNGVLISLGPKYPTSNILGVVSFSLPRNAQANIEAYVGGFNVPGGLRVIIPDTTAILLRQLQPGSTFASTNAGFVTLRENDHSPSFPITGNNDTLEVSPGTLSNPSASIYRLITGGGSTTTNPAVSIFEEFMGGIVATSGAVGEHGWSFTGAVGSISLHNAVEAGRPGTVRIGSATAGAWEQLNLSPVNITPAGGMTFSTSIKLSSLTNALYRFGLHNIAVPPAYATNGFFFEFRSDSSATNWRIVSASGGTRTFKTTNTTASTSGWTKLEISTNSNYSAITFKINGTEVTNSPITTNLPTVNLFIMYQIETISGVAAKDLDIDYFGFSMTNAINR